MQNKEYPKLRECPFCGGKAELSHDHTGAGYSYIRCTYCGLKSPMFIKAFDRASDNDAVNYWNRRYTPSEIDFDYEAED